MNDAEDIDFCPICGEIVRLTIEGDTKSFQCTRKKPWVCGFSAVVEDVLVIGTKPSGDPTRFLDRSFTWTESAGHSVRLIQRDQDDNDPRKGISIAWGDLPALRELITLALEDGPMVIGRGDVDEMRAKIKQECKDSVTVFNCSPTPPIGEV